MPKAKQSALPCFRPRQAVFPSFVSRLLCNTATAAEPHLIEQQQ